jgi:PAS domain S-box-containing protein
MLCICAILPAAVVLCLSQTYNFDDPNRWTHFTTESGLPSNMIQDIAETNDSTLWVAASSLAWFNGFQWKTVDSSYGLLLNNVLGVQNTFNDDIIVQGSLHGVTGKIFVGNKSRFNEIKTNLENPYAVGLDSGTVLIASNYSLYLYDQGSVTPYQPLHDLTRTQTFFLQRTVSGAVWLNLKSGLYRRDGVTCKLMIPAGTFSIDPSHIAENRNGAGITQFEHPYEKRGLWEWASSSLPKRNPTERATVTITFDVGPHDEAIVVYRSGDIRWREKGVWKSLPSVESRLHDITTVKFRANGDLLFGTRQGLFLFRCSPSNWTYYSYPPPDQRNHVSEIVKAQDKSFWMATSGGVEHRSTNGSYRYFDKINDEIIHDITALAEDSAGNIWIGSGSAFTGVYRFNGHRWEHFQLGNGNESVFVHKIRKDRAGRLWFLGLGKNIPKGNEPGAFEYGNGNFIRWRVQDGLINGRVYDFVEGSDGSFWFATAGGISRWKPETNLAKISNPSLRSEQALRKVTDGSWTHWTTSSGLKDGRITSVAVDQDNKLWFASNYPPGPASTFGIGCIDTLGSVEYFTSEDGLVNENIWDLKADSSGRVWIATTNGLGCYHHGRWLKFDGKSGLLFSNLWPVLPLGNQIFVGTKGRGVAILDLAAASSPFSQILIEKPFIEKSSAHQGWRVLSYWGEVDPLNALTRYRVDGGKWSSWRIKNGVVLNDMKAGDHTIEVQAKNLYGAFNEAGARAVFTIPQVWYRHPLFLTAVSVVVLTIVAMASVSFMRKRQFDIAIRESESKFRAVATTTASAILVFHDEAFLFANHSAETMTEYSQEELMNKSFWDMIHPEGVAEVKKFIHDWLAKTSVPRRFECKILTKKNDTKWIDVTASRIFFMNTPAVIVTAFDITSRKSAEEALRESSIYNELILQSVPFGMDIVDTNGTVLFASQKMKTFIGSELVGQKCWMMYKDDCKQCADCSLKQPFIVGETRKMVTENINGGHTFEIYHTGMMFQGKQAVLEIFQDITERKRYEERLKDLASDLVQTEERERRQMAAFLHDSIGQQLAMTKMKLDALQDGSDGNHASMMAQVQKLLQEAIHNTRSLTFDLSPPILNDLGLAPAIDWLVEKMKENESLDVTFVNDGTTKLLSDDLRSVLFNGVREALVNVVKHASARNVQIELKSDGEKVGISIEDDGQGISPDAQSGKGGFGLSNLRKRLTNLGGSVSIEPRDGRGTRVVLTAPLKDSTLGDQR